MRQKYSAPNPYCVPTYRERGLKSGVMIKLLPKPLLRPVLSGKGFKECRDEQYICPKPLKGLKEWSVDVFYDKMNILTYPTGLHIPAIYPDFYRESLSLPVPIFHRETRFGRLGAVLLTSRMVFTSPSGAWGSIIFEAWGGIIFMDSRQY